jgi:hypothetical protein
MKNRENTLWIELYIYRWKDLVRELLIDFMKSFPRCMGIVVGGERPPCPGYYLYLWNRRWVGAGTTSMLNLQPGHTVNASCNFIILFYIDWRISVTIFPCVNEKKWKN